MVASGVAVAGNLAQGNWKAAAIAAVGLTGVGVAGKFAVKAAMSVGAAKQLKSTMAIGKAAHKEFQRKFKTGEQYLGSRGELMELLEIRSSS